MSATTAEVFDRSAYAAPEAELEVVPKDTPDKLFSHKGRIGVLRYNARLFQLTVFMLLCGAAIFGAMTTENTVIIAVASIVAGIAMIVSIWLMVYQAIKRMHDLGLSGWFQLIGAIPILGAFWVLYYMLKPGKDEGNKYGNRRPATTGDKVFAIIGMVLMIPMVIISAIPEQYLVSLFSGFM